MKIVRLLKSCLCPNEITVVIKLIPPIMEAAPAKCNEKIAQSIVAELCLTVDSGGYTVHLHPAPPPTIIENKIIKSAGPISQ
jgi:hypothetical protein